MPRKQSRLQDRDRLIHMLEAAERSRQLVQNRQRSSLDQDDVLTLANVPGTKDAVQKWAASFQA